MQGCSQEGTATTAAILQLLEQPLVMQACLMLPQPPGVNDASRGMPDPWQSMFSLHDGGDGFCHMDGFCNAGMPDAASCTSSRHPQLCTHHHHTIQKLPCISYLQVLRVAVLLIDVSAEIRISKQEDHLQVRFLPS